MQIYLDNSATSYPKPENVRRTVANSLVNFGANPGRSAYKMAQSTDSEVYKVREKVASFFGASGTEKIVFTKNCTEGINVVINSLLKHGDHVVISDLEHNAVLRPIHALKGVEYTVFETFPNQPEQTINSLRKCLKNNTKLMLCTAASNVFGVKLPIGRLCALCHLYDIKTCIDAAQIAGVSPINVQKDMIDYLCIPSHKGLYGIMGAGAIVCEKELEPLIKGGTGTSSLNFEMPDEFPEKMESGTLAVPAILSIGAGIDFVNKIGINKIENEEMKKIINLYNFLKANNAQVYTDEPNIENFAPILSFNVKGKNCEAVADYLASKGICVRSGIHCAPLAHKKFGTENGTVRISPSVFTNDNQINYFKNAMKNILK